MKQRPILSILVQMLVAAVLLAAVPLMAQAPAATNCSLPGGAFAGSVDDPLQPVYCLPPAPVGPTTRVTGANDWVDNFGSSSRLNDGDLGYRVFDSEGAASPPTITQHLVVGDHWITDNNAPFGGGAYIRPNRAFKFENGKLIIEADVSAGKAVFQGNQWTEIEISESDHPDTGINDSTYAYGHFYGFWTLGCRFQGENIVCANHTGVHDPNFFYTQDKPPCYSEEPDRLWELSYFQDCGNNFGGLHFYNFPDQSSRQVFRVCPVGSDYDPCLDRMRMEISQSGLLVYVNGIRYFEDSGWDSAHGLNSAAMTAPWYVYFADWGVNTPPTRFHWGRLAINPHNPDGTFMAPSASPSFGQVAPAATALPTQSPTAAPTSTPSPSVTPTPSPTATALPTSTLTPIATVVATVVVPITCQVDVRINGVEGGWKPC